LFTCINAKCIEGTSNDVIPNTRKVAYTTAPDENDGVFLKVVTFTTDVRGNFFTI
jgi:hypothetical protein